MQIDGRQYAFKVFSKLTNVEFYLNDLIKDGHSLIKIANLVDDKINYIITSSILIVNPNDVPLFIKLLYIQSYNEMVQERYTLCGGYINDICLEITKELVIQLKIEEDALYMYNNASDVCDVDKLNKYLSFLKCEFRERKLERIVNDNLF